MFGLSTVIKSANTTFETMVRRFASGSLVTENKKKDARFGKIVESAGNRTWEVQFEGESATVILKSGQLRHLPPPAPPANHPPQSAQATTATDIVTPPAPVLLTEAASDDDSTEFLPEEFPETEASILEISASSTSSDEEEEANPLELPTASSDGDDTANVDHHSNEEDVADEIEETGENPGGGIVGDLEDEDVHKTKWNKYVVEKKKLINDGFFAEVKPRQLPPKQTGSRVQEVSDQLSYLFLCEHTVLLI